GLYISLNAGNSFMLFSDDLPRVAVHDLTIQNRDKDIVIGTHGRSIYKADLEEVQLLADSILNAGFYAFQVKDIHFNDYQGKKYWAYGDFATQSIDLPYYSKNNSTMIGNIYNEQDMLLYSFTDTADAGLNFYKYNLIMDNTIAESLARTQKESEFLLSKADDGHYYLPPGRYYCEWITESGNAGRHTFSIIQ
ncbi:MAG: hypothetical protein ACK4IY_09860, partial [Chitinophagales bacterium]